MKIIKLILQIVPFFSLLIFYDSSLYSLFGEIAWKVLIVIVFVRPLADVFPRIKIFREIVSLRKELGITCGCFGIFHSLGYFMHYQIGIINGLTNSVYYDLSTFFGWGMLAFYIGIILTITSNIWSMKIMKKWWKRVQRLTYLFFLFTAIHIVLVLPEKLIPISILISSYTLIYFLAYRKIVLWK